MAKETGHLAKQADRENKRVGGSTEANRISQGPTEQVRIRLGFSFSEHGVLYLTQSAFQINHLSLTMYSYSKQPSSMIVTHSYDNLYCTFACMQE